jgi:molybdenum cofactor cytidylyltransferase
MSTVGVVLAAGQGSRFAVAAPDALPKLLALVDGVPLVRRTVTSLLDAGVHRCVVVVTAENQAGIDAALAELPVHSVVNPDPARGMFSSVQLGVAAAADGDLCVLLPGDMPFVKPSTVAAVIAEASRTGHGGVRGHPLALSTRLRTRVLSAPPTAVLREELAHEASLCVDVDDPGVRRDVDRPSDLVGRGAVYP